LFLLLFLLLLLLLLLLLRIRPLASVCYNKREEEVLFMPLNMNVLFSGTY
jgi:hypothetical protein